MAAPAPARRSCPRASAAGAPLLAAALRACAAAGGGAGRGERVSHILQRERAEAGAAAAGAEREAAQAAPGAAFDLRRATARAAALIDALAYACECEGRLRAVRGAGKAAAVAEELARWAEAPLPTAGEATAAAAGDAPAAGAPAAGSVRADASAGQEGGDALDVLAAELAALEAALREAAAPGAAAPPERLPGRILDLDCAVGGVARLASGGVRFTTRCSGGAFVVRVTAIAAGDGGGGDAGGDAAMAVRCDPWLELGGGEIAGGGGCTWAGGAAVDLVRDVWQAARLRSAGADALFGQWQAAAAGGAAEKKETEKEKEEKAGTGTEEAATLAALAEQLAREKQPAGGQESADAMGALAAQLAALETSLEKTDETTDAAD